MLNIVKENLEQAQKAINNLLSEQDTLKEISNAGNAMGQAILNGKKILSCGNGGSMCDAMHFAEELTGRFREDRRGFPAIAISDPSYISCTANDYGFEKIFSRYIDSVGKEGDFLLAISTSGTSENILAASKAAKAKKMAVIGLSGKAESPLKEYSDFYICASGLTDYADRVQELHIKIIHTWINIIEKTAT